MVHSHILIGLDTWYRIIVKNVAPMQSSYSWAEMSFYTKWTPHSTLNLCFDVPMAFQVRLRQALYSHEQPFGVGDFYASHVKILDQILMLFDESVWALRDGVRQIEKVFENRDPLGSSSRQCSDSLGPKRKLSTKGRLSLSARPCKTRYTLN